MTSLWRFDQCHSAYIISDTYTEGAIQHCCCDVEAKVRREIRYDHHAEGLIS